MMNKSVKFTIITATYNSEKTIERTIKSVLSQTISDFEYVIIDGSSKDNTLDIIKKNEIIFKENNIDFKYISEKDFGIYDAWNKGIGISKGQWISFLGSDDYYNNNALEIYSKYCTDKYNYVHSKVNLIDEKDNLLKIIGEPLNYSSFIKYMEIAHVGSFHHRSLFENEKFSLDYRSASDYYFFLSNYNSIKSYFINKVTATMQYGGVSTNISTALNEALEIKLKLSHRSKILCHIDYYKAFIIHYLNLIFRKFKITKNK